MTVPASALPSDYAARRRELLAEGAQPRCRQRDAPQGPRGPDRLVAAAGVRRRGRGHRRTGRAGRPGRRRRLRPRRAVPGQRPRPGAAARRPRRRRPRSPTRSGTRSGTPACAWTTRCAPSRRPAGWPATDLAGAARPARRAARRRRPGAGRPPAQQRPRRLARGRPPPAARAARGVGRAGRQVRRPAPRPRARPQGGPRRAARRRVAARRRRLLGRRPAAPRTSTTPYAGWPTSGTRCTSSPAGPPTGCCCRSRTRSPPTSAWPTPTRCCARSAASAPAVAHAADVTWRRAPAGHPAAAVPVRAAAASRCCGCSGRGSPSTTARRCSPRRPTRAPTRCSCCGGGRAPPAPGCRCRRARSTGWPPTARRCRSRGRRTPGTCSSSCSAPGRRWCRSGRPWTRPA